MTKPRSDVIVRRFLAGENIVDLVSDLSGRSKSTVLQLRALAHVEACMRRALNRKRARR